MLFFDFVPAPAECHGASECLRSSCVRSHALDWTMPPFLGHYASPTKLLEDLDDFSNSHVEFEFKPCKINYIWAEVHWFLNCTSWTESFMSMATSGHVHGKRSDAQDGEDRHHEGK